MIDNNQDISHLAQAVKTYVETQVVVSTENLKNFTANKTCLTKFIEETDSRKSLINCRTELWRRTF